MNKSLTWKEKYLLALQEELNVKEIMLLRDVGRNRAREIRENAVNYCIKNNIEITSYRVPTEAVLEVTKKGLDYYFTQMMSEYKANNLHLSIAES